MSLSSDVRVGVLGGGQLGRMMLQAGIDLNLRFKIMDADPNAPCSQIAHTFVQGDLQSYEQVLAFGQDVDVLTIEIEKVNTDALSELEARGVKVYPQPHLIRMIQDKRVQKQFYLDNGIPTSPFRLIDNPEELSKYKDNLPAVLKLGKDGYDGKGVQILRGEEDLGKAFDAPSLLEDMVDIEKELSVIVARRADGHCVAYPLVELVYHPEQNLVDYLLSPAIVPEDIAEKAVNIATDLVEKMDFVGLLAVEMFWAKDGQVLVNEIAPRPHNSGHHSIEGNYTSQYQQQLRAILGLPLGSTGTLGTAAMLNILGEPGYTGTAKVQGLEEVLSIEGIFLHLYGKVLTKPYRKMGHVTILGKDREEILQKMETVKRHLKIVA